MCFYKLCFSNILILFIIRFYLENFLFSIAQLISIVLSNENQNRLILFHSTINKQQLSEFAD